MTQQIKNIEDAENSVTLVIPTKWLKEVYGVFDNAQDAIDPYENLEMKQFFEGLADYMKSVIRERGEPRAIDRNDWNHE